MRSVVVGGSVCWYALASCHLHSAKHIITTCGQNKMRETFATLSRSIFLLAHLAPNVHETKHQGARDLRVVNALKLGDAWRSEPCKTRKLEKHIFKNALFCSFLKVRNVNMRVHGSTSYNAALNPYRQKRTRNIKYRTVLKRSVLLFFFKT